MVHMKLRRGRKYHYSKRHIPGLCRFFEEFTAEVRKNQAMKYDQLPNEFLIIIDEKDLN